jgi:imidazolonepropionase-like amidohydrolase
MDTERLLPDHTVVIEEGRIRALGPSATVDVAGARVVDGAGQYLLPGLADMHVHYWDPEVAALYLANGVTLVRNMWGAPVHLALRRQVEEGRFAGPRIVTTTPIIDGPDQRGRTLWAGSTVLADPAQAAPLVRRYAARGYEQVKVLGQLAPEALRALVAAAREAGLPVTGHCPTTMRYEEAVDAGMACFEHLAGVWQGHLRPGAARAGGRIPAGLNRLETLRLTNRHGDPEAIRRLAPRLAAEQIWNCPTLVAQQQMVQRQEAARRDPHLRYVPPLSLKAWDPAGNWRFRDQPFSWDDLVAAGQAANHRLLEVIAILHAAGAPLLAGTDAPNPYVVEGFALHQELANFVAAGLSPFAAIRCATGEAARFVGQAHEWGTVAAGKRADLLLVGANPLADVAALRRPVAVFVNGFLFARADLDRLLVARERAVQAPPDFPVSLADLDDAGRPGVGGRVVREGTLRELVAGVETGRLVYRHRALADGGWLIEERYAARQLRRAARWWLASDFTLRRGDCRQRTSVGEGRRQVERAGAAGYTVHLTEVDGFATRTTLGDGPLVVDETAAATGLALLLAAAPGEGERLLPALSVDPLPSGEPCMASVRLSQPGALERAADGADGPGAVDRREVRARAQTERPGAVVEHTYRLAADGRLLGIRQVTASGPGPRELLADEKVA